MRDQFCSYYTESSEIVSYMVNKLRVEESDLILEPSAGEGIFIDSILEMGKFVNIDALDINRDAIDILRKKYSGNSRVTVRETDTLLDRQLDQYSTSSLWLKQSDTLLDEQLDLFGASNGHYDKVIGNPPYGAWQDYEKRDLLKRKYAGHYVKETYSLFLLRCISLLKKNGRLSFIIPDTYLFLNLHSKLREFILRHTKISEILIFPSKFFPGVSFGYSNLSIITLERVLKNSALNNTIKVIRGFKEVNEFQYALSAEYPNHLETFEMLQADVISSPQHKFVLAEKPTAKMMREIASCLGDVADVVTGFYCGDNRRFIRALNKDVKGSKAYETLDESTVHVCTSLQGVIGAREAYVPYVKSASRDRYVRKTVDWFIRWDEDTVKHYANDKKARFQNSRYYFEPGIAIPMVKSSLIKATLIEGCIFDQSIVGIFPKQKRYFLYILALMNSSIVNELIHIINPTTNNSANYIKKVPFIEPSEAALNVINEMVKKLIDPTKDLEIEEANTIQAEIDMLIGEIYTIGDS